MKSISHISPVSVTTHLGTDSYVTVMVVGVVGTECAEVKLHFRDQKEIQVLIEALTLAQKSL